MNQDVIARQSNESEESWKRIGRKRIDAHIQAKERQKGLKPESQSPILKSLFSASQLLKNVAANLFLSLVHISSRITNKPIVDIGQKYSVSALNERINTLEEILVKQWTNLKDDDFLTPNEEIKQYIASCHVARQYDRITPEHLSQRLGVDHSKADALINQMIEDEILTESYTVTYHDVRRSNIDAAIEIRLKSLRKVTPDESAASSSATKKH